jgi:4-amino-4-deoxy-L-arabinose transferase-like glycosyltransferase
MNLIASPEPAAAYSGSVTRRPGRAIALLTGLWLVIFFASLFSPPVFDDADGTHANAARQMLLSGDWVTLRVNNVRYLEKAPLPYWIAAVSFRLFGLNTFAAHLPQALAVLLLTLLGFRWARRAFGDRAALYTGLGVLTSAGVFLFTRVFLPDPLLSLLLVASLYCFHQSLEPAAPKSSPVPTLYPYAMWTALALAVLTKGLVALVFLFGTVIVYLILTGEYRQWRRLRPLPGTLLLMAIAAPWHILAGLRNTGGIDGHGFFWFYFVNEHILRFLGQRIPRDYNRLPGSLYWGLHLVWLFPWSIFLPVFIVDVLRRWRQYGLSNPEKLSFATLWILGVYFFIVRAIFTPHFAFTAVFTLAGIIAWAATGDRRAPPRGTGKPQALSGMTLIQRTSLLLSIYSFLVLAFFSLSTNQEYYTFPAYLSMLMLLCASLARAESDWTANNDRSARRWIMVSHIAFTVVGLGAVAAIAYGLWLSRDYPSLPDIGSLLAHRGVGGYTLSMSSLFDLTGASFSALRLPATLALAAFAVGPGVAWTLRAQRRHVAATTAVAVTSAIFLVAAHIALARFTPMLSSKDFAQRIQMLEASGQIPRDNMLMLFGDQAYGSSIPFYLNRPLDNPALLVDGRSSSMLFGSTFPDAQPLFLTPAQLLGQWGTGKRKLLFVPLERRDDVNRLLAGRQFLLKETSGKALITDRPLNPAPDSP